MKKKIIIKIKMKIMKTIMIIIIMITIMIKIIQMVIKIKKLLIIQINPVKKQKKILKWMILIIDQKKELIY